MAWRQEPVSGLALAKSAPAAVYVSRALLNIGTYGVCNPSWRALCKDGTRKAGLARQDMPDGIAVTEMPAV
jgi:hypothetical protein